MQITIEVLRRFAPHGDGHILQAIVDQAPRMLPRFGVGITARRLQHFFASIALESAGFTRREENLSYSAQRLTKVWPKRFPSLAAAQPFAHNPRALANKVYGGRMGNKGAGDGYRYRGRGPGQITGHDGYFALGQVVNLPLVTQPELVAADDHLLECAAAFFCWKNIGPAADGDQDVRVRKLWNGGATGLDDYRAWLKHARAIFTEPLSARVPIAKVATIAELPADDDADDAHVREDHDYLAPHEAPPTAPAELPAEGAAPAIVLTATEITAAQQLLHDLNYSEVGLPNGQIGSRTIAAIAAFKHDRGIAGAPVLDRALIVELDRAKAQGFTRPIAPERAEGEPEGSRITAGADRQATGAVTVLGAIGAYGMQKIEAVQTFVDGHLTLLAPVKDLALEYWWLIAIAFAAYVLIEAAHIRRARVEDHRQGKTT